MQADVLVSNFKGGTSICVVSAMPDFPQEENCWFSNVCQKKIELIQG